MTESARQWREVARDEVCGATGKVLFAYVVVTDGLIETSLAYETIMDIPTGDALNADVEVALAACAKGSS